MAGRLVRALPWALVAYLAGAAVTGGLIAVWSSNTHDRALEAVMTGAFAGGPVAAAVGLVLALAAGRGRDRGYWARRKPARRGAG